MKTRVDALTTFPRPVQAANEEIAPAAPAKSVKAWDAYEVWLTRIKALQDRPDRNTRHA